MMPNLKKYIFPILILLNLYPLGLLAFDGEVAQAKLIARYFAKSLKTAVSNIEVELIHVSQIDPILLQKGLIEVQPGRGDLNLGHQTIWMVHKKDGIVKRRYPVTIEVFANIPVPTAVRNISRLEILSEDLISMVPRRLGRDYQRILLDTEKIYEKMATQMIREGHPIERSMVRPRPDVLMGDNLQIIVKDAGLSLELPGIAKEEGHIGSEILVQCPTTRKEFRGILENLNEVIVSLR